MKTEPINITLPYRNWCEYKLELQIYDDHTCIYAQIQMHKQPSARYDMRFNSEWIPEKRLEWFGNILLENILTIANAAEKNTIHSLSLPIQEFKRLMNL